MKRIKIKLVDNGREVTINTRHIVTMLESKDGYCEIQVSTGVVYTARESIFNIEEQLSKLI